MNDHLAVLIYLTAAEVAGRHGWWSRVSSSKSCTNEAGGESRARFHLCNDALQQLSRVSIYATCGHSVRLPHKSQAACCYHFIPSAHSQHQQAPAAAGQGWGPPCRGLRRTSTLPSNPPYMGRYVLCCTCTVLVCWASDGC